MYTSWNTVWESRAWFTVNPYTLVSQILRVCVESCVHAPTPVSRRARVDFPTRARATSAMASADGADAHAFANEREVIEYFTSLSRETNAARQKIAELGVSLREHVNVLTNVRGLEPTRRCFRSVGGVLVERTVGEVIPAVETNASNLQRAIDAIKEQCAVKEAELEALRKKYKIRVQGEDESESRAKVPTQGGGGILA